LSLIVSGQSCIYQSRIGNLEGRESDEMKKGLFLLLLFFVTIPASATIVDKVVFEIDSLSVNSDFYASTGQLVWSNGGIATLRYAGGTAKYRVTVNATWSDLTDLSQPGGKAKASFGSGSFMASFFNLSDSGKTNPIASAGGTLYSSFNFNEQETQENPSELYGAAVVQLTSWNVPGFTWLEGLYSPAGLTATTSNISPTNIVNYQSDWSSDNTIVTLLADESGIPEPATICLLGLGAAGLISRRKRA
jgi:hypothetical protein